MPESKVNPVLDLKLKLDHEHPFLAERGITPEVAEAFGIGFADRGSRHHEGSDRHPDPQRTG